MNVPEWVIIAAAIVAAIGGTVITAIEIHRIRKEGG